VAPVFFYQIIMESLMVSRFFQILNSQIALVTILGLKIIIDNKLLTQMMKFRWGLAVIGPAQDA
jgi:hypothetical protein